MQTLSRGKDGVELVTHHKPTKVLWTEVQSQQVGTLLVKSGSTKRSVTPVLKRFRPPSIDNANRGHERNSSNQEGPLIELKLVVYVSFHLVQRDVVRQLQQNTLNCQRCFS